MKVYTLVLLCVSSLVSANAFAQWQWLDAQGRKVFSDLPPPTQVPADRILQRPGNARPAAIPAPSGPAPAAAAPATPADGRGVDRELQSRKIAEEAEAARRQQLLVQEQEKKLAQQRQDNCVRARVTLTTLVDGRLVAHTNAQGERAFMNENVRAQERQRAQGIIASDCGPAATSAAPRGIAPPALPSALPQPDATPPSVSRRDPTPPELARPGASRPGRPADPSPPTIQ